MNYEDYVDTGISRIDEYVIRGIPAGHTTAITGSPRFSSEKILHSFAATKRDCLYISAFRPEESVRRDIQIMTDSDSLNDNLRVVDLQKTDKDVMKILLNNKDIIRDGNVVIDTYTKLIKNLDNPIQLTRKIYDLITENKSVCYMYIPSKNALDLSDSINEVVHLLDGVIHVESDYSNGSSVKNSLYITKMRGIDIPEEPQTVIYTDKIQIDTTRDIS